MATYDGTILSIGNLAFAEARIGTEFRLAPPLAATPVITLVSPANGSGIAKDDDITVDVTVPGGVFTDIVIEMNTTGANKIDYQEVVYSQGAFVSPHYVAGCSEAPITDGSRFVFVRADNWPTDTLRIYVTAIGPAGERVVSTFSWTVSAQKFPSLSGYTPGLAAAVGTTDPVQVDAVDSQTVTISAVLVSYPGLGTYEVVYDGTLRAPYDIGSSITNVSGNKRIVVAHNTAWPDTNVGLIIYATDTDGHLVRLAGALWTNVTATPPVVVSSPAIDSIDVYPSELYVNFDTNMDTAHDEFTRITNYQIRAGGGAVPVSVIAAEVFDATTVKLTITEATFGQGSDNYTLRAHNVRDAGGNYIVDDPGFNEIAFEGALDPPVITLLSPTNGATGVSRDTAIRLRFQDPVSSVPLGSIEVTIEGSVVFDNGSYLLGWTGEIASITGGFEITFVPPADFSYAQVVNISAFCTDAAGNECDSLVIPP